MIADRARFRHARRFERMVGYHLPEQAFHGAMLEAVTTKLNFSQLDPGAKEQLLLFIEDFLRCRCKENPYCGCPPRKFAEKIIELRENGLEHRQISGFLLDEYGIDLYPADILSFLEDSVHVLEAILDVARIEHRDELSARTAEHIRLIAR